MSINVGDKVAVNNEIEEIGEHRKQQTGVTGTVTQLVAAAGSRTKDRAIIKRLDGPGFIFAQVSQLTVVP